MIMQVRVKEEMRIGTDSGVQLAFRDRNDLNFTVQGDYPSQAKAKAKAAFLIAHSGAFRVVSAGFISRKAIQLLVAESVGPRKAVVAPGTVRRPALARKLSPRAR